MLRIKEVLILDGYNDEPGGLGVPPYIDVYPRYIAGSLWLVDRGINVDYITVDSFRSSVNWIKKASSYDLVVVIAGVVVPGKYLGGRPAYPDEVELWGRIIEGPLKVLVGPAARWGMGFEGGRPAVPPYRFQKAGYHVLVKGDVEQYIYDLARYGEERASPFLVRKDYSLANRALVLGARIIRQHPNYGRNLVVEIETYRGCARWISGGCSFCVEPLRGKPIQRDPLSIVNEVKALYFEGARNFRLGRQADILVYGSKELGEKEWPRPSPKTLEKVFRGIRAEAPNIETLHIDNVNPGTIVRYPKESKRSLKIIVRYHAPGDVAAMGLESADPKVAKINNLNITAEEAIKAIKIVNEIGSFREDFGLPHLLPGINFILGLPGESKKTYELNREFLEEVLKRKLLVRRINIRKLMVIPTTRVSKMRAGINKKLEDMASSFIWWVRNKFEIEMLKNVVPPGTIIKNLWVEYCSNNICYARSPGSYPLVVVFKSVFGGVIHIKKAIVRRIRTGRSVFAEVLEVSKPWA